VARNHERVLKNFPGTREVDHHGAVGDHERHWDAAGRRRLQRIYDGRLRDRGTSASSSRQPEREVGLEEISASHTLFYVRNPLSVLTNRRQILPYWVKMRRVVFAAVPPVQILDLTAPYEIFARCGGYRVELVTNAPRGLVTSSSGLTVCRAADYRK